MRRTLNRRQVLKRAAAGAAGAWFALNLPQCARVPRAPEPFPFWFAVDPPLCIGCGACARACREEHRTVSGKRRTWIERHVMTADGRREVGVPDGGESGFLSLPSPMSGRAAIFIPKLCNQCEDPLCATACPVGAAFVSKEGFVLTDRRTCVGCGKCVTACPYGARYLDPAKTCADACDWCYSRIFHGSAPVCVLVCPTRARVFGRKNAMDQAQPGWVTEGRGSVLLPELGSRPRVAYSQLDP